MCFCLHSIRHRVYGFDVMKKKCTEKKRRKIHDMPRLNWNKKHPNDVYWLIIFKWIWQLFWVVNYIPKKAKNRTKVKNDDDDEIFLELFKCNRRSLISLSLSLSCSHKQYVYFNSLFFFEFTQLMIVLCLLIVSAAARFFRFRCFLFHIDSDKFW